MGGCAGAPTNQRIKKCTRQVVREARHHPSSSQFPVSRRFILLLIPASAPASARIQVLRVYHEHDELCRVAFHCSHESSIVIHRAAKGITTLPSRQQEVLCESVPSMEVRASSSTTGRGPGKTTTTASILIIINAPPDIRFYLQQQQCYYYSASASSRYDTPHHAHCTSKGHIIERKAAAATTVSIIIHLLLFVIRPAQIISRAIMLVPLQVLVYRFPFIFSSRSHNSLSRLVKYNTCFSVRCSLSVYYNNYLICLTRCQILCIFCIKQCVAKGNGIYILHVWVF